MSADASFILQELHLYNWGAFAGRHQVAIDPGNSAIIGPTGSGKTTLVDALMTLLCASPRYNLASTGGHESDRDLVSYVRGASGQGNDSGDHIARPGRCATGVAARLVREGAAGQESVWLGALLWFDGSSQSAGDMQKRWFFAQGQGHSLDLWLEEQHSGGARALTRLAKDSDGLQMYSSKAPYLAKLHSFFEVGPNAFTLLNRAAGLKQLNSIDEIFRELVLDDHSAFDDAQKVVDGFAELASIHADLELANAQWVSLLPLRDLAAREQQQAQHLAHLQALQQQLPHWFAAQGVQWWGQRVAQLQAQIAARSGELLEAQERVHTARKHEQDLHGLYLQAGGANINVLRENIDHARKELARIQGHLVQYQALARNLGLGENAGADHLSHHQAQAQAAMEQIDARQAELQASAEHAIAQAHNAHTRLTETQAEYDAVRQRPGSNLPVEFQRFRTDLADHLGLPESDLPFAAELLEVRKAEQAWRGAIERALGSHRLRILVPQAAMHAALQWVNQRHNKLHVRLLEVRDATPAAFLADGFARKLNLKPATPTAHLNTLRQLLSGLDRHCVPDVQTLERTPHAMTAQGLMSSHSGHFDKQDQKRLDQDWMTGFDNRDRLAHLLQQKELLAIDYQALEAEKIQILATQRRAQEQRQLWAALQALQHDDLDTTAADAQLQHKEQQLQALLHPDSDTAQAQQRWEAAQAQTRTADEQLRHLQTAQTQDETLQAAAQTKHSAYQARSAGAPVIAADFAAQLTSTGHRLPPLDGDNLEAQERDAGTAVQAKTTEASKKLNTLHTDIVRQMGKAKAEDRGALADHGQEVDALPHYLQRLQVLEEEALPHKRQRFQEYLNNTSQQGVDTLLNGIAAQVADIEERIAQLNATLRRVDFQPGRYLQLEPRAVVHQSLQELNRAQAQLRTESLRDDGGQSHYRALRAIVEMLQTHATNRRSKAAQALLDARYRLQFAVLVLERGSGQMLERRTGSQGGSGGEKEIIASYVLTASLSYALCPDGASRPVFGTIVLDEAFSKSSQAVAARIIQALREFGLHALFVTPNKEVRLLRNHTRSAVVVHRRGAQATLASLRWEEIDAFRKAPPESPAAPVSTVTGDALDDASPA
ncbi:AAA family ATPase [Acidovorax sp. JG5]|uniref:ATP-binding protein n=1 Tax=Acidovorax sp. JG5 TaxID=2822718 RepID=UPI001B31E764|nr:ATP-binding protein [Acidovorax sp. JG5]MBP3979365.1 AAA family ATPase [Acidovorax sp. JG5]